jgi:predicted transglutaminase-like cysteine proteinase
MRAQQAGIVRDTEARQEREQKGFCEPQLTLAEGSIEPSEPPASETGFLATKRVPIGRTLLSSSWDRVSQARLPDAVVLGLFGTPERQSSGTMQTVNQWVNAQITYVEDRERWSRADYWASASETLKLRSGDCEDYAILKYQILLSLGFPPEDMYLTLARDLIQNLDHAVLIVKHENKYFMLDNATDTLLPADFSYDYRPTLSFGSDSAWLHGYSLAAL